MWGISTRNFPRIRSYKEALTHFDSVTPLSSLGDNIRPLCARRDTSKQIINYGDKIALRYHYTDVVVYHKDGTIVVEPYNSSNTAIFATALLPMGINAHIHKGDMYVSDVDGAYSPKHSKLVFRYDGNNWKVDPESVKSFDTYKLDMKRAAQTRKILKPFLEWREAAERVGARFRSVGHRIGPDLQSFLREGHIPEHQYALLTPYFMNLPDVYVLCGAVTKVPLPLGALPRETPYDNSSAWAYV